MFLLVIAVCNFMVENGRECSVQMKMAGYNCSSPQFVESNLFYYFITDVIMKLWRSEGYIIIWHHGNSRAVYESGLWYFKAYAMCVCYILMICFNIKWSCNDKNM